MNAVFHLQLFLTSSFYRIEFRFFSFFFNNGAEEGNSNDSLDILSSSYALSLRLYDFTKLRRIRVFVTLRRIVI